MKSRPQDPLQRQIGQCLDLVRSEIRKAHLRPDLREDLRGVAYEALVRAARRFDPARGIPFRAFARQRIHWALVDYQRREDRAYRRAKRASQKVERLSALQNLSPSGLGSECADNPLLAAKERARVLEMEKWVSALHEELPAAPRREPRDAKTKAVLEHLLRALNPEERMLLSALYREGISLSQYARRLGISHSTASRRHAAVLRRLRALVPMPVTESP